MTRDLRSRLLLTVLPISILGAGATAAAALKWGWLAILGGSAILALVLLGVLIWLSIWITRPVKELVKQASRYEAGHFEEAPEDKVSPLEFRPLTTAVNGMGKGIIDRIEKVRTNTELHERSQRDHALAVSLQQTVLPRNHPLFPDFEPALDTAGVLKAGKEPGSDSYDAFELPSGRIAMVISGGTGKGLPAVILVTQIRLLIRLLAELGLLPHEILRRANRILARTASQLQQASVTLLFVDYDPITGVVRMASAGHPAPIKVSATGLAEQVVLPVSVPLAASGTTTYSLVESRLEVGETLILHTTGLSKAVNPGSDFFESDALKSALFTAPAVTSEQLASAILNASGAPGKTHPSDDITLLIARRLGGQVPARIDTGDPLRSVRTLIPAKAEFLGLIAHLVEESGRMAGLGRDATSDLVLAADEVMAKVIEHSPKAGGGHFIHLEFQTTVKGLRVIVTETGATSNLGPAVAAGAGTEVAGAPGLLLAKFSVTALTHEPSGPEGHRTILYQEKRRKPSNNLLP